MTRLARHDLGQCHAFVLGLVRQHRTGNHVADGVNARHIGLVVMIGAHPAAIVEHHARIFQPETLGERLAAGGDQHDVGFDGLGVTALDRLERNLGALAGFLDARHLGAELEIHPLLGEDPLELLGDLAVHAAQDLVEILDHRHLGAEPAPDRAHFQPDDAAADDNDVPGHLVERDGAGRGHDHLLVDIDLDARNAGDVRTGGDHDVLGFQFLGLAVIAGHRNLAFAQHLAVADEAVDLVLLEQEGHALDIRFHGGVLVRHHLFQIELRLAGLDAEAVHAVTGVGEHFRRMQQRL